MLSRRALVYVAICSLGTPTMSLAGPKVAEAKQAWHESLNESAAAAMRAGNYRQAIVDSSEAGDSAGAREAGVEYVRKAVGSVGTDIEAILRTLEGSNHSRSQLAGASVRDLSGAERARAAQPVVSEIARLLSTRRYHPALLLVESPQT